MGSFKRYRDIFIVIIALAVPFFVLRTNIRAPEQMNDIDRFVMRITEPIQYASAALARGISGLIGDYVYLVDVKEDNDKLAYENAQLRSRVRKLEALEGENRRLKRLLALKNEVEHETVSGLVVSKATTEFFRVAQLTLDGPGNQVKPNMPVLGVDGAVGTVLRVSKDKIDVRLTVDAGFGVDVVAQRTGARGFVRGSGDPSRYSVSVEYMKRSDEVAVGDLLLTSGVGCRFPKGIPVAKVTKVIRRDFGIYQQVEAEPTVDFSRLDEALIVLNDGSDCTPTKESSRR